MIVLGGALKAKLATALKARVVEALGNAVIKKTNGRFSLAAAQILLEEKLLPKAHKETVREMIDLLIRREELRKEIHDLCLQTNSSPASQEACLANNHLLPASE